MSKLQKPLRWIISRLANLTPNTIYYSSGWLTKIDDKMIAISAKRGNGSTPMTTGAIAFCCALNNHIPNTGDIAEMTLTGVTLGGKEIGNFKVTAERLTDET